MANLFSQLGKDFVRSAVKQVGRDGGKVISNHVYGDGHSTPVRGAGDSTDYRQIESGKIINLEERSKAESAGYIRGKLHNWGSGWCVVFFCMTFPFAMAGSLFGILFAAILIIRAIYKFKKISVTLSKDYIEDSYVEDRRYKTGSKYNGKVSVTHTLNAELNPDEKKSMRNHAIAYILIAILYLSAGQVRSVLAPYYHTIVEFNEQQR